MTARELIKQLLELEDLDVEVHCPDDDGFTGPLVSEVEVHRQMTRPTSPARVWVVLS